MFPSFNNNARKAGTGINAPMDAQERTALHMAVADNDEIALRRLLRIGANPNQPDKQGQPPLFEAVTHKRLHMLETLGHNSNTQMRDKAGRSLIDWAIEQKAGVEMFHALRAIRVPLDANLRTKRTALHTAAEQGAVDMLDTLLEAGLGINTKDKDGNTPLLLAAKAGQVEMMKKLIDAGANPNMRNNDIQSPLYVAAESGNVAAVDLLLAEPSVRTEVNSHAEYKTGWTPLMVAAVKNHAEIIDKLFAVGADVNQTDNQNRNSLFIAAVNGKLDAAKKLTALGADARKSPVSNNNRSPMVHWVHNDNYREMLAVLISAGADINATDGSGQTALHRACDGMHGDKIKTLLSLGANPNIVNEFGQRPIDELMDNYNYRNDEMLPIMTALLDKGASADLSPMAEIETSPMHIATQHGHSKTVAMMLQHNAQVDAHDRTYSRKTPLMIAVEQGKLDIAEMLVAHGANPLKTDNMKRNALHIAAHHGNPKVLEFILGLPGIDVNAVDGLGRTALHHACLREKPEAAKILMAHGASCTAYDAEGMTALHSAMVLGNSDMLQAYDEAQGSFSDWDARTRESGDTLLHAAVRGGMEMSIEKLLSLGADLTLTDMQGRSPLHLAIELEKTDLALMLVSNVTARKISLDTLVDMKGHTPLHTAAMTDNSRIAAQLVAAGADVTLTDSDGNSALHLAVQRNNYDVAEFLVNKKQVSVLQANEAGETALQLGMTTKNERLFNMLLSAALKEQEAQAENKPEAQHKKPKPPKPPKPDGA